MATGTITLRHPRPGDYGWLIGRHGALYWEEYGWNEEFEAMVAEITARLIRERDPARERGWIAELEGERVGCVFVTRTSDDEAKLRFFLVEPHARGRGLGKRLVAECIAFARRAGYRKMTLWTSQMLVAARSIYQAAGFRLVSEAPQHSFGGDWIGETWELTL